MSVEEKLRSIHKEIQQKITKMVPERYKKICLYASVLDESELSRGEMFFYYFPSGILKKNPINVYEIPELFDFDEEQYRELENRLYETIRKLKKYCVRIGQRPWSNVTIIMEGTKYIVEYNYDDLKTSQFDNYERHIIWRYKYLKVPIESYSKKEREVVQRYFVSDEYNNTETSRYEENVYERQIVRGAVYESVESHEEYARKETMKQEKIGNELAKQVKKEKNYVKKEQVEEIAETSGAKNQLLNF